MEYLTFESVQRIVGVGIPLAGDGNTVPFKHISQEMLLLAQCPKYPLKFDIASFGKLLYVSSGA